jgi:formylglycine-generating enzyme required for sulfatase activity
VPGGTYYRTYDPLDPDGGVLLAADGGATGEADPATVSGFRLDKYLVTVGRFRQWMNYLTDGGAPPEAGSGKHVHLNGGLGLEAPDALDAGAFLYEPGWSGGLPVPTAASFSCDTDSTWTLSPGNSENLPITCVTWFQAYAFCIWDGGFLPSDAEWGYAAAGGSQQREYPWGSTEPGTKNQYAIYCTNGVTENCYYPTGDAGGPRAAPVGTPALGEGRWGQLDLAGEVAEWVFDYAQGVVGSVPQVNPCTDCASLVWFNGGPNPADPNYSGPFRGSRTGPVETQGEPTLLSAYHGYAEQTDPQQRVVGGLGGFRCARTP